MPLAEVIFDMVVFTIIHNAHEEFELARNLPQLTAKLRLDHSSETVCEMCWVMCASLACLYTWNLSYSSYKVPAWGSSHHCMVWDFCMFNSLIQFYNSCLHHIAIKVR